MHDLYKIRRAEAGDLPDIARVYADCWKTTYKGIIPDRKLDWMSYEKSAEKWKNYFSADRTEVSNTIFLLRHKKETVGFCAGGKVRKFSKRTAGYEGEIKAVYILPDHQRMGFGTKFIKNFEEMFRKNKIFSYIIWVLKDNSSKEFYKKLGGKLLATKNYEIGNKKLKGLCFGFQTGEVTEP
ncbi:MAG: GNAT family N-acetyltransferase [Candidatus Delongbacteria bacterium]